MLGFAVIVVLYVVVGLLAATGSMYVSQKIFSPKAEQIFYAMFLIVIASFYLAFASYFRETTAWRMETLVVVGFAVLALLGSRLTFVLIAGYALHGLWDFVHELQAHGSHSGFEAGQLTAIPLAYGFFCAAFDFFIAGYFYTRRAEWNAAWKRSR